MLLTFNVIGAHKVERLASLARRTDIKVVSDNVPVIEAVAEAGKQAGRDIDVLIECDTGAGRNGIQSPEAARQLARDILGHQGVNFGGLMTFPRPGGRAEAGAFLAEAIELLKQDGIAVPTVSSGGTPDMWETEGLKHVSEYRAGTYIYNDRSLVARGTFSEDECAVHVLATVVSTPNEGRAVLDAGSKSLTSDLLGLEGYGTLSGYAGSLVKSLSEEHGVVDVSKVNDRPKIGDLVRVLPNHVCPVVNLFDRVIFVRGEEVLGAVRVDARGLVQ
jgi:D-serine deaminase-like pyridoxal phosphate-dependent protein